MTEAETSQKKEESMTEKKTKKVKIYAEVSFHTTVEIEIPEDVAQAAQAARTARKRLELSDILMDCADFRDAVLEGDYDVDHFEIVEDDPLKGNEVAQTFVDDVDVDASSTED